MAHRSMAETIGLPGKTAGGRASRDLGRLSRLAPKSTLGGRIYRLLEDAIVRGDLAPGQRLDEQSLADHFGVSRIPLREALSGLEVAGWIEKHGGRQGVWVRALNDQDLASLSEVRGALEDECAALATARHGDQELKALRANVKKSRTALSREDRTRLVELNTEFHLLVAKCSRNVVFEEILSMLDKRVRRALWIVRPDVLDASIDEHESLVDAMERGDVLEARLIARRHANRHADSEDRP